MTRPVFTHLFALGLGALAGSLLVLAAFSGPGSAPPTMAMASAETKDTSGLAAKLTPAVQQFLGDHRNDFAAHAGGPLERLAVRWGVPIAQRETGTVLEYGLDEVAAELGTWSLADVIHWFSEVAAKKGLDPPRAVREGHGEIQTRDGTLRAMTP